KEERAPGANLAALLSYSLWQRRFGGDAQVLGKTLELDKHAFTIVGVLPPGFRGQDGTAEAWVTMMAAPLLRYKGILTNARNYWFQVIARLKDGVTPAQAQAEMQLISERIEQKYPGPKQTLPGAARVVTLAPLQAAKVDPAIRKSFLILLAAVGVCVAARARRRSPARRPPAARRERAARAHGRRARHPGGTLGNYTLEEFPAQRRRAILEFLHADVRLLHDQPRLARAGFHLRALARDGRPVRAA